jgi:hypothetical protein
VWFIEAASKNTTPSADVQSRKIFAAREKIFGFPSRVLSSLPLA